MKPDDVKSGHMKNNNFLDMIISVIASNKNSSSSEQPTPDIMKWSLLKSPEKSSHTSRFTKMLSPLNLEGGTLPQIQNGGIPLDPHF